MTSLFLFAIPLSSYITLSVVVMVAWVFFVVTRFQTETATASQKRSVRPEPTPFTFFKPGENPPVLIPPSSYSEEEAAISVNMDKIKSVPPKPQMKPPVVDTPTLAPDSTVIVAEQPSTAVPTINEPIDMTTSPDSIPNPDFVETDNQDDYALFQPRQVSVIVDSLTIAVAIDHSESRDTDSTTGNLQDLQALQPQSDDRLMNRKRKTDWLIRMAEGVDFETYVLLFRSYFEQARTIQTEQPDRSLYVILGELIADEPANVQEQLLMLLDKEAEQNEPNEFVTATVVTDELIDEEEPAFT